MRLWPITLGVVLFFILFFSLASRGNSRGEDYQTKWQTAHRYVLKYKRERDWLQKRIVDRVHEVNRLHKTVRRMASRDTILTSRLEKNFLCIHGYEGDWTDPNGPFYGGLQMDLDFQQTYGAEFLKAWGTADHWPAAVQMAVAMKAYLTRGFWPWPNTARYCGLI